MKRGTIVMPVIRITRPLGYLIALIVSLLLMSNGLFLAAYASSPVTLGSIQNLSTNAGVSTAPVVAVVGSNVYVAWEDTTNGGRQTFFRMSSDGGSHWSSITAFTGN